MNHWNTSVNLLTDRQLLIGMTLSECHTSVIALCVHVCVCLLAPLCSLFEGGWHMLPLHGVCDFTSSTLKSAGRAWQNDF